MASSKLDETEFLRAAGPGCCVRRGSWPWFIRPHLHYFTPETLDAMLARAGFDLVDWATVPRTFHASYIAERATSSHGASRRLVQQITKVIDPRVPVGWPGDVVLAIARPHPTREASMPPYDSGAWQTPER